MPPSPLTHSPVGASSRCCQNVRRSHHSIQRCAVAIFVQMGDRLGCDWFVGQIAPAQRERTENSVRCAAGEQCSAIVADRRDTVSDGFLSGCGTLRNDLIGAPGARSTLPERVLDQLKWVIHTAVVPQRYFRDRSRS